MISCAILTVAGSVLILESYKTDTAPGAIAFLAVGGLGFLYEFVRSFWDKTQPPEKRPPIF
jgi:hypothetical protein